MPDPRTRALTCWILLTALSLGCLTSGQGSPYRTEAQSIARSLEGAPIWVTEGCRAHTDLQRGEESRICGVGSAPAARDFVAAEETAIARARAEIARSLRVTLESLMRIEAGNGQEHDLEMISHQLASVSLRGARTEAVWRSSLGEVHALVSLDVRGIEKRVRNHRALGVDARENRVRRAAAFNTPEETLPQEGSDTESRDPSSEPSRAAPH